MTRVGGIIGNSLVEVCQALCLVISDKKNCFFFVLSFHLKNIFLACVILINNGPDLFEKLLIGCLWIITAKFSHNPARNFGVDVI